MILSCNHISKSYGVDTILDDCSFFVNDGEKAAIVGNNGAGKSTIMKIIMGELSADNGTITLGKNKTIGYLAQYQDLASHNSIYDEVKSVKADIINMEKKLVVRSKWLRSPNLSNRRRYLARRLLPSKQPQRKRRRFFRDPTQRSPLR